MRDPDVCSSSTNAVQMSRARSRCRPAWAHSLPHATGPQHMSNSAFPLTCVNECIVAADVSPSGDPFWTAVPYLVVQNIHSRKYLSRHFMSSSDRPRRSEMCAVAAEIVKFALHTSTARGAWEAIVWLPAA
jgi:hypothetical protein